MNTKKREGGRYYDRMWEEALSSEPSSVSITSYNEWGEGTQIEPAVPKERVVPAAPAAFKGRERLMDAETLRRLGFGGAYEDYGEGGPELYLAKTLKWAEKFRIRQQGSGGSSSGDGSGRGEL